ncbi:hypothetical protein QA601_07110 [Chitinispirillales bacterium ANBcel5]|uniref:hypothetical protein n=1 Tax=Cellulosispirillum alkaliphilum TaxID=3039283 RepID=UPI002A5916C4|nr:hypothetical protein [Chitinispirillales bacterium ANBcel5]
MKWHLCLISIVLITGYVSGSNDLTFLRNDSGYSVSATFVTSLPSDTVLNILYEYDHVSRYSFEAGSTTFKEEGEGYYTMEVMLSRFFYQARSHFLRKKEDNRVIASLDSFWHNRGLIPEMIYSHSVYDIRTKDGYTYIDFKQDVRFAGNLNRIYLRMIEGGVKKFKENLENYLYEKEKR